VLALPSLPDQSTQRKPTHRLVGRESVLVTRKTVFQWQPFWHFLGSDCQGSEHQRCDRRWAWASSSARGSGCGMTLSWLYSLCSSSVDEGGITIWMVRKRSPWPPAAAGSPLPFSRSLLSARLPGGTFTRTGSVRVGAITSAPKAASHGKTGSDT
jgi:hypothetical protein